MTLNLLIERSSKWLQQIEKRITSSEGKNQYNDSLTKNIKLYQHKSKLYTNLLISSAYDQNYQIQLMDDFGKVIFTKTTDINSEAKVINLPTNDFVSGKYYVIVSNKTEEVVLEFEK